MTESSEHRVACLASRRRKPKLIVLAFGNMDFFIHFLSLTRVHCIALIKPPRRVASRAASWGLNGNPMALSLLVRVRLVKRFIPRK